MKKRRWCSCQSLALVHCGQRRQARRGSKGKVEDGGQGEDERVGEESVNVDRPHAWFHLHIHPDQTLWHGRRRTEEVQIQIQTQPPALTSTTNWHPMGQTRHGDLRIVLVAESVDRRQWPKMKTMQKDVSIREDEVDNRCRCCCCCCYS